MQRLVLKKYIKLSLILTLLILALFSSYTMKKDDLIFNKLYAAQKTDQSSTSTTKPGQGTDMTELLARLINGEARGEKYQGQVAVGAVILNRVNSPQFPNTISAVIYQKGQFSCITDGQFDKKIEENSTVYKAAKEAISGADPSNGALYFYNPKTAKSKWLFSLKTVATIGNHRFAVEE